MLRCFIILYCFSPINTVLSQITTTLSDPISLVQNVLLGSGVSVSNVKFTGWKEAIGSFKFNTPNTSTIGLTEGIILTTGTVKDDFNGPHGPNNNSAAGIDNGYSNFQLLNDLVSTNTLNTSVLEFDFVPQSPIVQFRYVFGSEEYPEFAGSTFNDVFAFFIKGPGYPDYKNIATLPNGSAVTINNVNNGQSNTGPCQNCQFYKNNGDGNTGPYSTDSKYVQYDGFTKVLEAKANVQCGQKYHLIIAVGDVGDAYYDSGIFLEAKSLSAEILLSASSTVTPNAMGDNKTIVEGCANATIKLKRTSNVSSELIVPLNVSGSATQGVDYTNLPTSVTFPANISEIQIPITVLLDEIDEGSETLSLKFNFQNNCNQNQQAAVDLIIKDLVPVKVSISQEGQPCIDHIVTLKTNVSGGIGPFSYQWSDGKVSTFNSLTSSVPGNKKAHVLIKDNSLCPSSASDSVSITFGDFSAGLLSAADTAVCSGDSFKMIAFGGDTYAWTPANLLDNPTISNPTVKLDVPTVFKCAITSACGFKEVFVNVNVFFPNFQVSEDTSICYGKNLVLNATGSETVSWSPTTFLNNPTSFAPIASKVSKKITYVATGITIDGCVVKDSVFVDLLADTLIPKLIDTIRYCIYSSPPVVAVGAQNYSWFPSENVTNANSSSVKMLSTSNEFTYCTFSNQCFSLVDSIYSIVIIPNVQAGPDTSVCKLESVNLVATGGISYVWIPYVSLNTMSSNSITIKPSENAEYLVVGTDEFGCVDTANVYITVFETPTLKMPSDTYASYGDFVELNAVSSSIGSYRWTPNFNIACSECPTALVNPNRTTSYKVEFVDLNGCKNEGVTTVFYAGRFFVPNTFTPTQNSINSEFFGLGVDLIEFEMIIYNRWGEVVFEGDGVTDSWDGTQNGSPCAEGTYIWTIRYKDYYNEVVNMNGNVNLLR